MAPGESRTLLAMPEQPLQRSMPPKTKPRRGKRPPKKPPDDGDGDDDNQHEEEEAAKASKKAANFGITARFTTTMAIAIAMITVVG